MARDPEIRFGPFRLDCANQQLWRGEQQLALQPKQLAVLQYLVQHAGRLVTKEELLQQVWAGMRVTPKSLTVCVHSIRAVLGDTEATAQFLETQGKQGYRFIASLTAPPPVLSAESNNHDQQLNTLLVGRETELTQLQEWYAAASAGTCTLGFVSGEAGIGKTTLVNRFVANLRTNRHVWVGVGQCIQHHGAGEAYLPVLTVLSQFARRAEQEEVRAALQQYSPHWMSYLPILQPERTSGASAGPLPAVTPQRLLWELSEAFRVLTERRPIVLILEDLQWSDTATVDWLAYLARWQEPLRLLIIGTYRPVDVIASDHPLYAITRELGGNRQSAELPLELLNKQHVHDYCTRRFPESALPARVITLLHRRTEGHPLFLVRLVEYLVQHGFLTHTEGRWQLAKPVSEFAGAIPNELQGMIAQQVEQLSVDEQRILEVASVAGEAFASEVITAGMSLPAAQVETICDELVRKQQVIEARGMQEWPDGTLTACYGFQHALFREVVYRRLGEGRRIRLHRAIADRLEVGYGARAVEIAGELAVHCTQGRDYDKGAKYSLQAADNALRLSAYREAITHCQTGLGLLAHLPVTPERDRQEYTLQVALSVPLTATTSWAAPGVERAYARALELCQQAGETSQLFTPLWGLWALYFTRGEYKRTRELAEQLLSLAQSGQSSTFLPEAHYAMGVTLSHLGEFASARVHLEQGLALYEPHAHRSLSDTYGSFDRRVASLFYLSFTLWFLGYPDQALTSGHEAIALAQKLSHPFSLALALDFAARLHQFRREGPAAQELAEAAVALCTEQGFPFCLALGTIVRSWALAEQGQTEGVLAQMHKGLNVWQATGAEELQPYFLAVLAEIHSKRGQVGKGLTAVAEASAWVDKTGERFYEAELYRLKGHLLLAQEGKRQTAKGKRQTSKMTDPRSPIPDPQGEAEACFLKAIEIARRQEAKPLELRAAMSLARLWQQQGKHQQAHTTLSEIYGWFTEGFDTKDLQEAEALLAELA